MTVCVLSLADTWWSQRITSEQALKTDPSSTEGGLNESLMAHNISWSEFRENRNSVRQEVEQETSVGSQREQNYTPRFYQMPMECISHNTVTFVLRGVNKCIFIVDIPITDANDYRGVSECIYMMFTT